MEHYIHTRGYAMAPGAPPAGDNVTRDEREGTQTQIVRNRDTGQYLDLIHHKAERRGGKKRRKKTCNIWPWANLCVYTSMCVGLFGLKT